jgi:hypothetical protein
MRGCGSRLRLNFHARLVLVPSRAALGFSSQSRHGRSRAKVSRHKEMEKVVGEHQRRAQTRGMALVRMDKDEENVGELHGMNTVGEGGCTHAEVTRVMAVPLIG